MLRHDPLADHTHIRRRLLDADARFKPAYDIGSVHVSAAELRLIGHIRRPHFSPAARRELEIGRQRADNCIWTAVERERLTDDGGVAAESPLPKTVTQQHDVGRARTILARLKGATEDRLDAERLEKIGRPAPALTPLWPPAPSHSEPPAPTTRHPLDR